MTEKPVMLAVSGMMDRAVSGQGLCPGVRSQCMSNTLLAHRHLHLLKNSLTCGLAPPRGFIGSATTSRPLSERALLTVQDISLYITALSMKRNLRAT